MPRNNLPLYTVIPEIEFKAIPISASHRKGSSEVVISSKSHIVGLRIENIYYAEQFGSLERAKDKFKELKEGIRNGKITVASSDQ